jgi:hypothetical protein
MQSDSGLGLQPFLAYAAASPKRPRGECVLFVQKKGVLNLFCFFTTECVLYFVVILPACMVCLHDSLTVLPGN